MPETGEQTVRHSYQHTTHSGNPPIRWRRWPVLLSLLGLIATSLLFIVDGTVLAARSADRDIRDLFFGEALFYAYQDKHFDAVARLDTELTQHYALDNQEKDTLSFHRQESEIFIGDLELSYRLHRKVGRAMKRLLNEGVNESIRNKAAYRLARIGFNKASYEEVIEVLDHITRKAPDDLTAKAALLRGQALLALGQHEQAAQVLKPVRDAKAVAGYAAYNLGIAMLGSGDNLSGIHHLDQVGAARTSGRVLDALRDKANLAIGYALLNAEQPEKARPYLERVHLKGPFSNKALLWTGWTDAAKGNYREALVPWMMLRGREVTDIAVQEALLAAPYGFGQLEAHGRAALLYGEAVESFEREIGRLNDSIKSVREGKFLEAMVSEAGRHKESWLVRLRDLPDAPETRYLQELMASHVFHESYNNYRDLQDLKDNVERWLAQLPAYHDIIRVRRQYYEPLLPRIEQAYTQQNTLFRRLQTKRDELAGQLQSLLHKRDVAAMATLGERQFLSRVSQIEARITRLPSQPGLDMVGAKAARLKGVLLWRIETEYDNRLSIAHHHMKELNQTIAVAQQSNRNLERAKAEATLSYQGYDGILQDLRTRLEYLRAKVDGVMAYQGQYMERQAINELNRRKSRLERYRSKARFALAESYDRATRATSGKSQ